MAIDNQFGKGIGVAAGFDLGAQKPLDARIAVNTIAERDAHVENNRAYEGMIVYVAEANMTYQLVKGNEEGQLVWQELAKAEKDRLDALEAMLNGGEGAEGGALGALQEAIDDAQDAADAAQADVDAVEKRLDEEGGLVDRLEAVETSINEGGDIENRISQNEADIDALEAEIGVRAVYDDEGASTVQAKGMYKYIDDQDAQLRNEIGAAVGGMETAISSALAEAKKHAEDKDLADKNAQATKDSEQDNAILALQQKFEGEQSVDNKIQAVQDNLDTFEQAQETAHQALTKKDGELDQAIKDEKSRAEGIEQGLQNAIDAINNEENGILAQAKALDKADRDAQLLVDQEQDRRLTALEEANAEGGAVAEAIAEAKEAAQAAQDDVDAVEKRLDDEGGLVDRIEANEAFVAAQPAIDQEQDRRITELENANKENGAVANAIKAAQDAADAAQGAADAAQADADALEQRLDNEGGLVDRLEAVEDFVDNHSHTNMENRLGALEAKFGEGENTVEDMIADAQAAAEAEAARLDGVMQQALQAEIDKKVAKADYDVKMEALDAEDARIAGLVATERGRAEAAEQAINDEIANMKDATKDGSLAKQIADEVTARQQADNDLDERVQAIEESIGDGGNLEQRVAANEDAIAVINGEGEGSIKKAVADLVNGAPETLDTLDELAAALRDNADVLTAVEQAFDKKLSDQKTALQGEIDADVKVVADELAKQKDAAQEGTLAKQIADEVARATGQEAAIRGEFAAADAALKTELQAEIDADVKAEADIARAAEKDLQEAIDAINDAENGILAQAKAHANSLDTAMDLRMDAVEEFVQNHSHEAMEGRLDALENANKEGGAVANAIKAAQDAADQAQNEVDAVEGRMDTAEGEIDALQEFVEGHDHSVMEQGIADNKAAIKVLNGTAEEDGSVAKAVKDAVDAEATIARAAEEALGARIDSIFAAYDGDATYDDLDPLS